MKLLVLNGPNINFVGIREKHIYGSESFDSLIESIKTWGKNSNVEIECKQSNHEGDLVDFIQQAYFDKVDGIVFNPGAYTHTSIAILDALKAVSIPCIEVHISHVNEREEFRKISYIRSYCLKTIEGLGLKGYINALDEMKEYILGR